MPASHQQKNPALRIVLIYLTVGYLWVLVSDWFVSRIPDRELRILLQTFKGSLFISLTGIMIYVLIRRYLKELERSRTSFTEEQERLKLALMSSHTGVWEWDLRTDRVIWSPEVYDIVGLPGFDGTFPSFVPLVHPDDLDRVLESVRQALASKEDYTDEFRIIRPDTGEVRWLINLGRGQYDAEGSPVILMGTVRDITEQKLQQDALQVSEERINVLLQGVKVGIWDWDLQSGLAYLSPEYYEIAEYDPESVVPDLAFFRTLVYPDDYAQVMDVMDAHLRNETEDSNVEFRIVTGNGTTKWISSMGKVVQRDQSGTPLRLVGTMVDVSGRRQAEDRFELFFNIIPDLACIATLDGYFLKVNPVWISTFGYSEQELRAVPYLEFVHPDDRQATTSLADRQSGGSAVISFINRYRCKDGRYRWLEWTSSPTNVNGMVFATARDITERKLAEEALHLSTSRLQRFYDSGMIGVVNWKIDGTIVDSNDMFLQMVGYTREEMVAGKVNWIAMTPPEYAGLDQGCIDELLLKGFNRYPFEKEYERKDGVRVPVLISGAMLEHDESDGIAFILDMTERKRTEAQLHESENRFKEMFRNHSAVMLLIEPETGVIIDANLAAETMYGYPYEQLVGMPISNINTLVPEHVEHEYRAALHNRKNYFIFSHRIANGDVRTVEVHSTPISHNNKTLLFSIIHDITERKLIEQELVRSEEQFFKAFDRCPFLMTINRLDDHRFVAVNEFFLTTMGLTRDEAIGKTSLDVNMLVDERQREHIKELLAVEGYISGYEVTVQKPVGENLVGLLSAEIITLQQKPHVLITINDITELKQKDKALRESEERYRRLFEVESDAVMVIDNSTGKFVDANGAALSLYGYTLQELYNLGPADVSAEPEKTLDAIKLKDRFIPFRYHRKKDGTVFPVELAASFFEYQGHTLYVAAIRNISERVLAESQLRTSEKMYRSLFENMLNGFAYCRMIYEDERPVDFVYLGVNDAFYRLTGLSEVIGKRITQVFPGFRETGRELLELYGRVARAGVPETFENYLGMLGDWYNISVYSPEPEYFVAVFDVVTDRKEAERRLLALNEKLRTLTEHVQFVQEQERLSIARDIHDDVGQQLTALKLDVSWLAHRLAGAGCEMGERLAGMEDAIDLLLARVQQIASELRPPLLDNLGLAAAIEWQVSEFTRRSSIECIVMLNEDAEPDTPRAATSVVRVVQEALTNVSRHAGASEVSISLCRHDGEILLEITDNGRGIEDKDIMSADSYGVLGMQERARLCGGRLDIGRMLQGGTRLRMTIPAGTGGDTV